MTQEELNYEYLDWMYDIVCDDRYSTNLGYRKLFAYLYSIEFTYTMPMDGNRYEDGINLRYRFAQEQDIDYNMVASYLDQTPCSVLEMMIALSLRCEEQIMDDDTYGNRVGQWFWEMIVNLGLGGMTDEEFDPLYVQHRLHIFLNRTYDKDGHGGLFQTVDLTKDMRTTEIWYQMHCHLIEVFEGKV